MYLPPKAWESLRFVIFRTERREAAPLIQRFATSSHTPGEEEAELEKKR
jgi:hypothetical protein